MKTFTKKILCTLAFSFFAAKAQAQNTNEHDQISSEFLSYEKPLLMKNDKMSEFNFELSKYLGLWYEQAHLPTFFQKNCDSSTALYSLNDDGTVKVLNTCNKLDGSFNDIVGKATIDPKDSSGRSLIVSFNFITDIVCFLFDWH